ncbi:uncharacterized protein K452DRAFT_63797 [Aplosporella prunicola CBS 121167]|uniref:Uncharacterized protein n=1 Tax=Aplosporella prunicola CBS 121167 TaxID=1176127 RepID=A0A6A6B6B3_9PEZI|nr:uncharacterized protein K452DRAFT_63797 [Aplosporella prunicola CBS 121167]KAF2139662.1 hypothetical protein K452DRAFT_63797 [Aplosporella prunicola CBS 121167]
MDAAFAGLRMFLYSWFASTFFFPSNHYAALVFMLYTPSLCLYLSLSFSLCLLARHPAPAFFGLPACLSFKTGLRLATRWTFWDGVFAYRNDGPEHNTTRPLLEPLCGTDMYVAAPRRAQQDLEAACNTGIGNGTCKHRRHLRQPCCAWRNAGHSS